MLAGSEEKIICHTSARFHVIILITWMLTLYTLSSLCIFSLRLFSIHFQRCPQGEFVQQSQASLVGDHFLHSHDFNVRFKDEKLDASHS